MPDSFDYTTGTNSENVRLLQALIDDAPEYTEETNSRNANILKSIINNTEYTDAPQSEIEELLLRLKAKIGGEIEVDELNVTENGTYDAGVNKAYNPVTVELPLSSKTITENGTYTASDDNLAGYDEVTVAVEGYAKKSIANTPTPIATFNASALPMPSLTVGIEATQAGNGDPSPTNVRPISGWSAVNRYRTGINIWDEEWEVGGLNPLNGDTTVENDRIRSKNFNPCIPNANMFYYIPNNKGNLQIVFYDKNKTYLGYYNYSTTHTYETPTNCYFYKFNTGGSYGATYNNDISINYPSTDTDYHAYSGTTYTTTLKDGQGNPMTCYGGQLVNENGVQTLTDEVACDDIGSVSVTYRTDTTKPIFQLALSKHTDETIYSTATNAISSCYKLTTSQNVSQEGYNGCFAISADGTRAYIQDLDYTDATLFKTARTGQKICYKLATPQTIPQDNLAIATQEGTNNLWADSGDVLSGEYLEAL